MISFVVSIVELCRSVNWVSVTSQPRNSVEAWSMMLVELRMALSCVKGDRVTDLLGTNVCLV